MRPRNTTVRSDRHRSARPHRASAFAVLAILTIAPAFGCKQETQDEAPKEGVRPDLGGWYRVVFQKPGVSDIPIFLSLPADPTKAAAIVLNGRLWFAAPHKWEGERVEVDFTVYRTKLLAAVGAQHELFGTFESSSRAWGTASLPIRAVRIEEPDAEVKCRTADSPPPEIDPSGVWKLTFDKTGPGKLILAKEGPTAIGGTIWFAGADSIYLSGNVIGRKAILTAFDGTSPYYLSLDFTSGHLEGEWMTAADLSYHESLKGRPVKEDFAIAEPVTVTSPDRRLRLPELDHPRYAEHPVIVEIAGSWCSHCKSAAPVLSKLYEKYESQGLRILTINYEFTEDKSYNLQRAAQFKSEYGITWQLVTRDGSVDDFWRITPTGLSGEGITAFPITIFLERDGTVHQLHSGFVGPESGDVHERLVKQFDTWTREILR